MMSMRLGSKGRNVRALQRALREHGFDPGRIDGDFRHGTEAAVMGFQKSEKLLPDGIAGPKTLGALGLADGEEGESAIPACTVGVVSRMFPFTPLGNIKRNLPPVTEALVRSGLDDKPMVLMALSTIRAETDGFEPIAEGLSRFNTSPNGHPFDLYDNRSDLGNQGPPDGERFRGRGYIQLTGRYNYRNYGRKLGLGDGLVTDPDRACEPPIAAKLLALFLKDREGRIREALHYGELRTARRLVNGGTHGIERFEEAYRIGDGLMG